MKRLFPLLVATTLSSSVAARTIESEEAGTIAADFMEMLVPGRSATLMQAPNRAIDTQAKKPYYIYNNPGGGYVIVSGDDRLGSILGYSRDGYLTADDAPEGLRGLLGQYEAAYATVAAADDSDRPSAVFVTSPTTVVEPLLRDINWGQDTPFNHLTPTYTSGGATVNYYTGCVAAAATQIMRLYSWPPRGTGSKTYTDKLSGKTLSADFGNTVYDWENMPAKVPQTPTEAQKDAYSTLAAQMGVALEMQYEASGSGTYDMLVPHALRTYFGYDSGVRSHNRIYYSTGEWMDMIKTELDSGRPVFYGGTSDVGTGGHAFVIDGYDSEDFVHVNWGWYGRSNGYFMINHLDPSSLGEGGGAGGYNLNQDMVVGIRPAKEDSQRQQALYGATRLSIDGPFGDTFNVLTYLENIDIEPFKGRIDAVLLDSDNNIIASLGGENVTVPGFAGGFAGTLLFNPKNVVCNVSGVPDGQYRMRLAYTPEGSERPTIIRHPKGLPAYSDVIVSRGFVALTGKHAPAPDCVLRQAISTDGDLYAGGVSLVRFTVENRSADYVVSAITLRLTNTADPADVYDATLAQTVYDESTETVSLLMPVDANAPAGTYKLTALVKTSDNEYVFDDTEVGCATVTVLPATDSPVVRAASDMVWRSNNADSPAGLIRQGETFYGVISLRNAATPGNAAVLARFVNEATGKSSPFVQVNIDFSTSNTQTVTFGRYIPFDPGTYRIELLQVESDDSETAIAPYTEATEVKISPSEAIVAEMLSLDMPEVLKQGERVSCALTYRGLNSGRQNIYIRLRRFTNSGGEIAYMSSQNFEPGVEKSLSFNYRPGSELADGLYMVIAETGNSSAQLPMGNYAAYGRVIAIGEVSGVDFVNAEDRGVAIWAQGRTLHILPAGDHTINAIRLYTLAGSLVLSDSCDLSALSPGLYLVDVTLDNGHRSTAKIVL